MARSTAIMDTQPQLWILSLKPSWPRLLAVSLRLNTVSLGQLKISPSLTCNPHSGASQLEELRQIMRKYMLFQEGISTWCTLI
jgi:hypothetical protein